MVSNHSTRPSGRVSVRECRGGDGLVALRAATQLATLRNLVLRRSSPKLSTGAPPDELAAERRVCLPCFLEAKKIFSHPVIRAKAIVQCDLRRREFETE